jgi:AcrR family transcriptional regulator
MEDIARGTGMSRAALYLHYKNKEDILRSLMQYYFAGALGAVEAALQAQGTLEDKLLAAFYGQAGEEFEVLLNSPHGDELMDVKSSYAAQIVTEGETALVQLYRAWLEREVAAGRADLNGLGGTSEEVAAMLLNALHGLKYQRPDYERYSAARDRLARLFARGLVP